MEALLAHFNSDLREKYETQILGAINCNFHSIFKGLQTPCRLKGEKMLKSRHFKCEHVSCDSNA